MRAFVESRASSKAAGEKGQDVGRRATIPVDFMVAKGLAAGLSAHFISASTMKTALFSCATCVLLLLLLSAPCWAQKHGTRLLLEDHPDIETSGILRNPSPLVSATTPPPNSAPTGYWVIETTYILQPQSTVRFYDNHHTLLYEEALVDFLPDATKRTYRRAFRQLSSVLGYVLRHPLALASETTLLAQQLRSHGRMELTDLDGPPLANATK
jgi:hypothetical protein